MKYLLIVNPVSGPKKNASEQAEKIAHMIRNEGHEVEVYETQKAGDGVARATQALGSDTDVIVAFGGDGTINEVGRALKGSEKILGILPNGSGNGLARELNISMDLTKAVKTLLAHNHKAIDTCEANGEPFFTTCGIGFDGVVSEEFASSESRGLSSYVTDSINSFNNYKSVDYLITIDGREVTAKAFVIAIANASQYGNNAFIAPNASMTDGLLDITIIKDFPKIEGGVIAWQLFSGELPANKYTSMFEGKDITIIGTRPMPYHIDGEPRPATSQLRISVIPSNLHVIVGSRENREWNFSDFVKGITTSMHEFRDNIQNVNQGIKENIQEIRDNIRGRLK